MRRLWFLSLLPLALSSALAQSVSSWPPPAGTIAFLCVYNAVAPTMTTGLPGYVQCDINGQVKTTASGGGGGGAVTIADGADVTQGAIADAAATAGSTGTLSAKLRLMTTQLGTINTTLGSPFQAGGSIGNTTFASTQSGAWNITNVSGTVSLPTGASTSALQTTGNTALTTINTTLGTPFQAGGSIGNTTFGATQAIAANLNATVVGTGTFATQSTLATETTKVIGTVNVAAAQTIATTNAGTFAVQAQPTPVTSGGLTVYFVQPTASDNHVVIKASAGQVYKISATNNSATINYLRLYNATTGFNGCNSATNLVYQMAIPASTSGAGYSDSWDLGMPFATGISICVTSGYATTDTTNATASAMSVNVGYK